MIVDSVATLVGTLEVVKVVVEVVEVVDVVVDGGDVDRLVVRAVGIKEIELGTTGTNVFVVIGVDGGVVGNSR